MLSVEEARARILAALAPVGTEWVGIGEAWGRVLGLPLLIADAEGAVREPFSRLGAIMIDDPAPRRRRRSMLRRRRPSIFLRRKPGRKLDGKRVHHGEREIIARN